LVDGATVIWAEDLLIADFNKVAFRFDIIELNTNVKATALKLLLRAHNVVVYLDPDIQVFAPLEPVFEALTQASFVVTPHCLTAVNDGKRPGDLELLKFGVFNLGFIGIRNCLETSQFLDWWEARCLSDGFYEPQAGLAVDQKWVDVTPCFYPGMRILRDVGLNVAFWNLHERILRCEKDTWWVNDEVLLRFVHFSSFADEEPGVIAKKQDRFPPNSRTDFLVLCTRYRELLQREVTLPSAAEPYSYDYFENGLYITPTLRRYYAALSRTGAFAGESNPFAADGVVLRFARRNGLLASKKKTWRRQTFKDLAGYRSEVRFVLWGLRMLLKVIGPLRYFDLMRFLAHVSSIRNQAEMFSGRY
jgi:hypothetical protein